MSPESRPREFHVLEFAHHDEAAAFVAALSRFLVSPRGAARAGSTKKGSRKSPASRSPHRPPVEVWARSPVASEGVALFLSETALVAAKTAFPPVPVARTIKREALPDDSFLIIEGGVTPAWGAAEASARLSTGKP